MSEISWTVRGKIHEHMEEFHFGDGYEDIEEPAKGYSAALHAQITHDEDHENFMGLRKPHIHHEGKVVTRPSDFVFIDEIFPMPGKLILDLRKDLEEA